MERMTTYMLRRDFFWFMGFRLFVSLLLVLLLLIFSLADIKWNKYHPLNVPALPNSDSNLSNQMIIENLKKVNEEIKQSSGYLNDQFNKKFILVGGLLSFILIFIKERFAECIRDKQPLSNVEKHIIRMCETDIIWAILALALIICISIDIQERSKTNIANAHGAWIAHFIEAPVLNVARTPKSDVQNDGPLNGWESYLRLTKDERGNFISGFHHDDWGHLLFAVQFHYLTIVLYIMYVFLLLFAFSQERNLQETSLQETEKNSQRRHKIALFVLIIVQVSILGFTIISRHSSEVFEVQVIPFLPPEFWVSGISVDLLSLVLGILPTLLLLPFIKHLCKGAGII